VIDDIVYLLSPARSDGARARMLLNPTATFDLALRLRSTEGAPLGEIFSFLSGLYFRGKLEYAFAHTGGAQQHSRIKIITSNRGLCSPIDAITHDDLKTFSTVDIAGGDSRYLAPLERDVDRLAQTLRDSTNVVLLGSIATGKYVDTLLEKFGERLLFPVEFVGRGDMSRGGLLLRAARTNTELDYVSVTGAALKGKRAKRISEMK